jgi:CBS domain containing-hemolysin-like protein
MVIQEFLFIEENIDKIIGLVYIKDIISRQTTENWQNLKGKRYNEKCLFYSRNKKNY